MVAIAVLGVGRVGAAVARAGLVAGYDVRVAGSGSAEDISLLTHVVIPGAQAMTAAEAVQDAEIVVIAIPLHKFRSIDPTTLAGKVVIDAMNYWAPVDGVLTEFEAYGLTSSEVIAGHLRDSRVVKTLNHIGYHELESHARPAGSPDRRALAVASDDVDAAHAVMRFLIRLGFDAIHSGPLYTGAAFQPGTPIFTGAFTSIDLELQLMLCPTP